MSNKKNVKINFKTAPIVVATPAIVTALFQKARLTLPDCPKTFIEIVALSFKPVRMFERVVVIALT